MNLFSFLSEEDSSSPWGFLSLWSVSWDGSDIRTVGSNVGRRLVLAAGQLGALCSVNCWGGVSLTGSVTADPAQAVWHCLVRFHS